MSGPTRRPAGAVDGDERDPLSLIEDCPFIAFTAFLHHRPITVQPFDATLIARRHHRRTTTTYCRSDTTHGD